MTRSGGWGDLVRGEPGRLYVLLCLINLLNYIDRQAVTGLLEPIRIDLGATDAQMGLVGSAFLLTYALLPPVFGWLGDRVRRTRLLASSAAAWCLATAASGLVGNIGQLAVARAAVGIGEASYMANTPGIISDLFPPTRRARALSIFYAAAPIGAALGVAIAGYIAGHFGWRVACFLVGLPGLLLVAALYRSREPGRGTLDGAVAGPPPSLSAVLGEFRAKPVLIALALGFAGQVFVQNAVEYWLPTILQRDKAIPIATANATYGVMVFIAGIVGPLGGAIVGDWAIRRTARGYYLVSAFAIGAVALPIAVISVATTPTILFGAVLVEALLGNFATGLVMAAAMGQVGAQSRSTTAAILLTTMHLLGDFISWPLVGSLSTAMSEGRLGALVAAAGVVGVAPGHHLTIALIGVSVPAAVLAAVMYLTAGALDRSGRPVDPTAA